ncbi:MAG: hypothetical protein AB1403_13970 [Candidatus Riflebacteria bacterium]
MKNLVIMSLIFSVVFLSTAFASGKQDVSRLLRSFEKSYNCLKSFESELKTNSDPKSLVKEFEDSYKAVMDSGDELYNSSYSYVLSREYKKLENIAKSIRFKLLQGEPKAKTSPSVKAARKISATIINRLMNF